MITRMDRDCGTLLALLKELKIDQKTLVIFTSDNGAHGIGGTLKQFKASGILRGKKRDLFEGGVRVPMIARWPGKIEAGSSSEHVSAFWDWMPTFCELAGAKNPDGGDGFSILPEILGKPKQRNHDSLYWEFYEQGGKQAVLKGDWKAVRLGVSKNRNAPIQLFNLKKDPSEENDIANKFPEKLQEMASLMKKAHSPSEIFKFSSKAKNKKKSKK
jgi:arylsulfatase A